MGRGHQGVQCTTSVAFGFSIKASASPGGPRVAPQVPPAVVPPWAPLSTEAVLAGSLPPRGWLKVLGAWEGGWGCPSSAGDAHAVPEGLLFEDVVNEQLTRQEHAEQEPRAGTVQEAWGWCLPGLCRGAQHGREMPGMIGHRSSAGASPGRAARPCPRVQGGGGTQGTVAALRFLGTHSGEGGQGWGSWPLTSSLPPPLLWAELCPPKSSVGILTPSAPECNCIWRCDL